MGAGIIHPGGRGAVGSVFFVAFAVAMATLPPAAPARGQNPVEVREVQTVWTSEHGVDRPTGIAYDPIRGQFLVSGEGPGSTVVLRLGPDQDGRGTLRLPSLSAPRTLAFDPVADRLLAFEGDRWLEAPGKDLGAARPPTATRPAAPTVRPLGATVDPASGATYLLEPGAITVMDGGPGSSVTVPEGAELIAAHPRDGLLYLMSPGEGRIDAVDAEGNLRRSFDLASVGLADPVGMVFAPTTDSTDDPDEVNLFVADAGGRDTLGGVVEVTLAEFTVAAATEVTATLVQTIHTSAWTPGSPDPSGVTWIPSRDELVVVDSEVDETTGAGWHNVNLWRSTRTGQVVGVGTLWGQNAGLFNGNRGFSREPTGAGYDPGSNTLFVSDDSARRIFVIRPGGDAAFGTTDDVVTSIDARAYGSDDTEDPEFDPVSGHLFFLDGVGREIFRVDPVDGVFGNGNDRMTHYDISHLGPTDFEGLALVPGRGTLYVGARRTKQIFEVSKDTGSHIRTISATSIPGLTFISGLAAAPASTGSGQMSLWIVDRAVDNGANSNENDGRLFEITAPDIGGPQQNLPPSVDAGPDQTVTLPAQANLIGTVNDDGLPSGTLTQTWSKVSGPGSVTFGTPSSASTTAGFELAGTYVLRLTASDGQLSASDEVTVTVLDGGTTNHEPIAVDDSATTPEDTPVTVDVLANDSDPDQDPLTVASLTQPANGSAAVVAGGIRYTPAADFHGTDSFTYRAGDGSLQSNVATVTVTVTPVNDPPVAQNDSASTSPGTPVAIAVLANDNDVDGDPLTVQIAQAPPSSQGSVTVNANQTVTFTPAAGFTGTSSFTYRASDGTALSNLATVTVTVADVVVEQHVVSQTTSAGSTSGSLSNLQALDGSYQTLKETHSGGPPPRRVSSLEHRWTFQVQPGQSVVLVANAFRQDNGEGDDFLFQYAVNGGAFQTAFLIQSATMQERQVALPPSTSGTVVVRVVDTDRTPGNGAMHTLTVDRLLVRTTNPT